MTEEKNASGVTPEQKYQELLAQARFDVVSPPRPATTVGDVLDVTNSDTHSSGTTAVLTATEPDLVERVNQSDDPLGLFDATPSTSSGNNGGADKPPVAVITSSAAPGDRTTSYAKWIAIGGASLLAIVVLVMVLGGGGTTTTSEGSMSAANFQTVNFPVHSADGPTVFNATSVSGFAQTPQGAALAALHLAARTDPRTSPSVFAPIVSNQTSGTEAAKAAMLADRQAGYQKWAAHQKVQGGAPVIVDGAGATVLGWKVDQFTTAEGEPVVVHLLVQQPLNKKLFDLTVPVTWDSSRGDYSLVIDETRMGYPTQTAAASADGFTLFFPTTKE